MKDNAVARYVLSEGMQHHRKQRVIGLGLNCGRPAGREQRGKQIEDPRAALWQNVELEHGRLSLPWAAHCDGAVTSGDATGDKKIFFGPTFAGVKRIMHNLTAHFLSIQITPA